MRLMSWPWLLAVLLLFYQYIVAVPGLSTSANGYVKGAICLTHSYTGKNRPSLAHAPLVKLDTFSLPSWGFFRPEKVTIASRMINQSESVFCAYFKDF